LITDELILQCIQGHQVALRHLYEHCYPTLIKIGNRYAKDKEQAIEIVTNSYLKIVNKLGTINQTMNIGAWIHKVGVNTAIDSYRVQKKYHEKVKLSAEYSYDISESIYIDTNSIDKHLESKYIIDLIQQLPELTRQVLNLYALDGYNHRDIAELLSISEEASRWHLFKARKLMLEKLQNQPTHNKQIK
jgi:RNA polymerase sigma factor (sigma-70 family)